MYSVCWEPWASTTVDNTPWIPRDVHRLLKTHLLDEEDAPGSPLPSRPLRCTMHFTADPELVGWCGIPYTIIKSLVDDLQASLTHLETHEVIIVPPHPLGAPQVYCLVNKGPTPCPSLWRVLFFITEPRDLIRPLGGPYDMYYLSFHLLRGLLFYLWASLVGLSPKVRLLAHYFIFEAYVGLRD